MGVLANDLLPDVARDGDGAAREHIRRDCIAGGFELLPREKLDLSVAHVVEVHAPSLLHAELEALLPHARSRQQLDEGEGRTVVPGVVVVAAKDLRLAEFLDENIRVSEQLVLGTGQARGGHRCTGASTTTN